MKVLGALVAMVPFASSLVLELAPRPCPVLSTSSSVSADRKARTPPEVVVVAGLRQPRKASRDKKAARAPPRLSRGAAEASARCFLILRDYLRGDEAEELR